MAIETMDVPGAAYDVVRGVIARLAADSAFRTPNLRRVKPDAIALSTPHRVAFLALDRIRRGHGVRAAARVRSWRFLVHGGDRPIAAAEAVMTETGDYRFGGLNEGPFVEGTAEAIRRAEQLDAIGRGRFEPLLLIIPALRVAALWLKERGDGADVFLAMQPSIPKLAPYEPMTQERFLGALQDVAEQVPSDSARGG